MISSLVYNVGVRLYQAAIFLAAPFNKKALQWVQGRRGLMGRIEEAVQGEDHLIWFHAASLGEFEQGRPLMEAFKKEDPDCKILLTFFSPSGYEVRKNYEGADYIFYLPIDSPRKARRFVEIVEPDRVFFIKYEFWFNFIHYLHQKDIPLYYVSAIFRPGQHFFKSYGGWFRKKLRKIRWFFVQNQESLDLLASIGIQNTTICGDTRFDRVWSAAQTRKEFPEVASFAGNHPVLLAGSTWPPDEALLIGLLNAHPGKFRCIIAPHEIHPERMDAFAQKVKVPCIKYSERAEKDVSQAGVLFIDNIGILLHLYQYAHVAYIGGGFGKNIHNILEAATFGKPIIFGPNYHKFNEAKDLLSLGGAFCIHDFQSFETIVQKLMDDTTFYHQSAETCSQYVQTNRGGTERILAKVLDETNSN
jgi:3-deoxy-D-manno-octulosonic-acid transferase